MIIGFLMLRNTFLKTLGGVIEEGLKQGHRAVLFYDPTLELGAKSYQSFGPGDCPTFVSGRPDLVDCTSQTLPQRCAQIGVQVLVTQEGYNLGGQSGYTDAFIELKRSGVKTASVCNFYETSTWSLEALDHFDKTYYLSEYARQLHFSVQPREHRGVRREQLLAKQEVVGSPVFDLLRNVDPDDAREAFGIARGKKVVLLISPVVSRDAWHRAAWSSRSRRGATLQAIKDRQFGHIPEVWSGLRYDAMIGAIKDFCDRSGALMAVKARPKQTDPSSVLQQCDLYIDGTDDEYYPTFTTHQLLSVASLCITAASFAALEAAEAGVPVLSILIPPFHRRGMPETERRYNLAISDKRSGPFNHPGCVFGVDRRMVKRFLRDKTLEDFTVDQAARSWYTDHYSGMTNETSGRRIVRSIEALVAQ